MDYKKLKITYADPNNLTDTVDLTFTLRTNTVTEKWINQVLLAQKQYSIDHPGRFYGFRSIEELRQQSLDQINECIRVINNFEPLVDRYLTTVDDQDTLNYLHHIFETYHGLLDQQTHDVWLRAPKEVQRALADLNIEVHRCESVSQGAMPRHVVTYYGLPKTQQLNDDEYIYFTDDYQFGSVYLNYVEIGKTLEDLAVDNDQYIGSDAFRPFRHYSADFNVKFWHSDDRQLWDKHVTIKKYYDDNKSFFQEKNLYWGHPYLRPGSVPLADLDKISSDVLEVLNKHQWVKSVTFI